MRLELIGGGGTIEEPGEALIRAALEQVYAEKLTAVILIADQAGNKFMQVPMGGGHVEYTPGKSDPIYAVDDVPLDEAIRLFLSYARDDGEWEQAVKWKVFLRKQTAPLVDLKKAGNLTLYILLGAVLAIGLCGGLIAYQQAFDGTRDAVLEALIMGGVGLFDLLIVLILSPHTEENERVRTRYGCQIMLISPLYVLAGTLWVSTAYHLVSLLTLFVWVTGIGLFVYSLWSLRRAERKP
jgi:hypothetical protein